MRIGTIALAASTLLFAATASAGGHGAAAATPDFSGITHGRQAGMRMSGALMGSMKAAVARGDDVKTQSFAARTLQGWAKSVPGMFPEGSNQGETSALPAIWSDWAGFQAASDAYLAAATKLATAAQAGDKDAFSAALGEVAARCSGCHAKYKIM